MLHAEIFLSPCPVVLGYGFFINSIFVILRWSSLLPSSREFKCLLNTFPSSLPYLPSSRRPPAAFNCIGNQCSLSFLQTLCKPSTVTPAIADTALFPCKILSLSLRLPVLPNQHSTHSLRHAFIRSLVPYSGFILDHAATFPNKILPTPVIVFLVNNNAIAYIVHQQLITFTQRIIDFPVFLFTVYHSTRPGSTIVRHCFLPLRNEFESPRTFDS